VAITRDIVVGIDDGYERAIHSYQQAGGRNPGKTEYVFLVVF
jgi:hypothetical protein